MRLTNGEVSSQDQVLLHQCDLDEGQSFIHLSFQEHTRDLSLLHMTSYEAFHHNVWKQQLSLDRDFSSVTLPWL